MKEFRVPLSDTLMKGLRRDGAMPSDKGGLVECHNIAPTGAGYEPHEQITSFNANGISWGGLGIPGACSTTRTITISIKDYVDESDIVGANIYLDDVLKGQTDANGELIISDVSVGGHDLKVTAAGYVDSDADDLLNDFIMVI